MAIQSTVMIVACVVLWAVVWDQVGGWDGLNASLGNIDPELPGKLLHVGGYAPTGVAPWVVIGGMIIALVTCAVINQYEAIRFLGARSEWDFKMAGVVASVVTAAILWMNVCLGPLAHSQFPGLEIIDQAYPLLVKSFLPAGLVGLVAAGYSTFDSIGIGISSLFVRDIYARFIVQNGTDAHYKKVGQISIPCILALGFLYVPFLDQGMVALFLRLAGAITVPLMTVMLMGVFTYVRRETGVVGLTMGLVYGISAIVVDRYGWNVPIW